SRSLLLLCATVALVVPGLKLRGQQQPLTSLTPPKLPGTLRGIVVHEGTAQPIPGVLVTISRLGTTNIQRILSSLAEQDTSFVPGSTLIRVNGAPVQSVVNSVSAAGPTLDGKGLLSAV